MRRKDQATPDGEAFHRTPARTLQIYHGHGKRARPQTVTDQGLRRRRLNATRYLELDPEAQNMTNAKAGTTQEKSAEGG